MINYRKMAYKDWSEDSFVNLQRQLEDEQRERMKMASKKVRVNTTNYLDSHGRSPKGTGLWMFFRDGYQYDLFANGNLVAEGYGTYAEVKAKAVAKAKELWITEIFVGS